MVMMSLHTATGSWQNGGCENIRQCSLPLCLSRLLTFFHDRYLVESGTLNICNRWRRERGESELTLSEIGAQGDSPS